MAWISGKSFKMKNSSSSRQRYTDFSGKFRYKANDEIAPFLSERLSIPKARIEILSGHSSRLKKIEIDADVEILHTLTTIK
jgi:hypothetical protein